MKKKIKLFLAPYMESFLNFLCKQSIDVTSYLHKKLRLIQWGWSTQPEWFDHSINLYRWSKDRNPLWLERGVFSSMCLKGERVLELACGDGFNTKHFYSLLSRQIVACDFDKKAIKTAVRKNLARNISFVVGDIRTEMPEGVFENIIFDAAIEHFTPQEIELIMKDIKKRLTTNGILSGYTIVEKEGGKSLSHHEYEFKNMNDLRGFLTPHFKNVTVFETIYPMRHNLYFWASDGPIPFSKDDDHSTHSIIL